MKADEEDSCLVVQKARLSVISRIQMGNAVAMQIVFVWGQPFHVAPYIAEIVVGHKGLAYQTQDTRGCGSARICQLAGEFLVASVWERGSRSRKYFVPRSGITYLEEHAERQSRQYRW